MSHTKVKHGRGKWDRKLEAARTAIQRAQTRTHTATSALSGSRDTWEPALDRRGLVWGEPVPDDMVMALRAWPGDADSKADAAVIAAYRDALDALTSAADAMERARAAFRSAGPRRLGSPYKRTQFTL